MWYRTGLFLLLCIPLVVEAQTGTCRTGIAFEDLNIGNVRARIYNTGGLFSKGGAAVYEVPRGSGKNAIRSAGLWIGGLADGVLHMAASTDGPYEFYPGPLDENGNPPADCSAFDRIYNISIRDIERYRQTGIATRDMLEWPWELGAEVIDGDGNPNNYNLAGNDLPGILGDQTLWWVMNDRGNSHGWSGAPALGMELQATVFAKNSMPPYGNTTAYRYRLLNKGGHHLTDLWFGLWADADLGNPNDDYVGSDTLRTMAYIWNGTDFDDGGYGTRPPALGVVFQQGPLVNADGIDNDADGDVDEDDERLPMTRFLAYEDNDTVQGNPKTSVEIYRYLQGLWLDGLPMLPRGTGGNFTGQTPGVPFLYPGDPPAFWSEENTTGAFNSRNIPGNRRMVMSTGPFTMAPGDEQVILLAMLWVQGADRFESVRMLKTEISLIWAFPDGGLFLSDETELPDPDSAVLHPVYPNPVSGSTTLSYTLPRQGRITLTLHDVLGRAVKNITQTHQRSGTHQVVLETTGLPPGVYWAQLHLGHQRLSAQPIIVHR